MLSVALIVVLVVMGVIVYVNNPHSWTNRFYALVSIVGAWWVTANALSLSSNTTISIFFSRQITPSSVLACLVFYYLALTFPYSEIENKRYYLLVALPAIAITILSGTSLNFSTQINGGKVDYTFGALYWPYVATMLFYISAGVIALIRKMRRERGAERQRIIFVLYGFALAIAPPIIIGAVLPAVGINTLSNFSPVFLLFFIAFTGYSILRHRLFNIRAVVARSVAYIFSIAAFAFLYAFLTFGLAQGVILKNILTTELSQQIFNVILAVLLAFTFPAIRRFFQKITDSIFYRDRYDPQLLVSDIGRVLASEIELDKLSAKVLDILQSQMRLAISNIVVMGQDGIFYQTHSTKIQQLYHPDDLKLFKGKPTITDELVTGEKREILDRHNVRAIFPLKTTESFVGYLLLGEKKSGDIFSGQDIQTLQIIANELAVAIQNARSYTEIQRFNETLREKIRQATAELTHANKELKALDKAKDEFISMASHQLRTPLTAVRGYTSMVMDGDFGRIGKEQKETLKQSFDAATRMTRLVDDLLNVSRIQSGKFRIERAPVDLKKVLPEELALLETTATTKNVTLQYHEPKGDIPTLSIDEGKTRQCLMNMMDNAIYYSSTGKEPGKVDIYLETDGQTVTFKVVDNGIGVPKSEQAKLFKKFYRAPNAQQARPDGTGLGLFLVGRVVHDQGGEIIFESTEGKGSTFGFKLPVKPTGEGVEAETKSVAAPATPKTSSPQA